MTLEWGKDPGPQYVTHLDVTVNADGTTTDNSWTEPIGEATEKESFWEITFEDGHVETFGKWTKKE